MLELLKEYKVSKKALVLSHEKIMVDFWAPQNWLQGHQSIKVTLSHENLQATSKKKTTNPPPSTPIVIDVDACATNSSYYKASLIEENKR